MRWLVEWGKLACYWLYGMDGTDRPGGVGVVWRDRCKWAPDWEFHHWLLRCVRMKETAPVTNFIGVGGGAE